MTVTAENTTSGTAAITNNSNGQSVSKQLTSSYPLCQQDAEWIVEAFLSGADLVLLDNFGTVHSTDAKATTSHGSVGPFGTSIFDIRRGNETLTSVSVSDSSVTIRYV